MIRFRTALLLTAALSTGASAVSQPNTAKPADATVKPAYTKVCPDCQDRRRDPDAGSTRTFYLKYATSQADANEIANALRSLLPEDRLIVIANQSAIVLHAIPEDMALAEKTINDLDRPKKAWRLTYTLTEMDGNNRIGAQHYAMDLVDGQQSTLKQGSRVPIVTGTYTQEKGPTTNQYTYQSIGITFESTLSLQGSGARLSTDIEQDSVADQTSNPTETANHPIVTRNSSLKGAYLLSAGKPLVIGSMDIPGSTRRLEIEALIEPLP